MEKYKKYRNLLTKLLKSSKMKYFQQRLIKCQGNIKTTWGTINYALNKVPKTNNVDCIEIKENNDKILVNDKNKISNMMNKYFISIGNDKKSTNQNDHTLSQIINRINNNNSIYLKPITSIELKKHICSLKSKNTCGVDEISTKVVKEIAPLIENPLLHIFNLCLTTGIFPDEMKIARVIPIHKSGDRLDLHNYRPISLLPAFSKLLEKAINMRITDFFESYGLFYDQQHGFRKSFSTSSALLNVTNYIKNNLNKNIYTAGVFIDLSKAFDSISHEILLKKLCNYGIRGIAHKLIKSYLENRLQYVDLNDTKSTYLKIACGVPQGSILGPTLFLIYINDIYKYSTSKLIMYADDVCLMYTSRYITNLVTNINEDLIQLNNWFDYNKLTVNTNKSNYMIFHSKHNKILSNTPPIKINMQKLEMVQSSKFLGVILDDRLTWKPHVHQICKKLSTGISYLTKVRSVFPCNILKYIYRSFVECYITYGI